MREYNKPVVVSAKDMAEGIFSASGSGKITFSKDHENHEASFYNINIPAEWQNPTGKTKIIINLDTKATYFDCRTGDWKDGRMESEAATEKLWAYNYGTTAGPVSQFAIIPKTANILSVQIVSE